MKHIKKYNKRINESSGDKKLSKWELDSKIEKIINSNIENIPYEGTEVDKYGLKESILDLIYELCPEYRPEGWGESDNWNW
jgi:hypothetical protein